MNKKIAAQTRRSAISKGIWDQLPNDAAIKVWASDLLQLQSFPAGAAAWSIVGQGVMIEAHEEEDVLELIHHLVDWAKMKLLVRGADGMEDDFLQWFNTLELDDPTMIFLAAGGWQGDKFAEKNPEAQHFPRDEDQCRQFRTDLATLMLDKLPDKPVVLVTVIASVEQMHVSLRSADLFGRRIQMPKIPDEVLATAFIEEIGHDRCGPSIVGQQRKVACLLRHEYPGRRRRALMQKAMQRLAWRTGRLLAFEDMVRFAIFGTCDLDEAQHDVTQMRRNAIHEAGHALLCHLTSRHQTAPEFCSILPRNDISGIVVSAFDGHERNSPDLSWKDMTHKLRVKLAGRAAEHLLLGAEEVSAQGSSSDLENATQMASLMFGLWGLPDDCSSDARAGSNLAVIVDEVSAAEAARMEVMVRHFLQKTFEEVLSILRQHRAYLESLVQALTERQFLLQEDLLAIHASVASNVEE